MRRWTWKRNTCGAIFGLLLRKVYRTHSETHRLLTRHRRLPADVPRCALCNAGPGSRGAWCSSVQLARLGFASICGEAQGSGLGRRWPLPCHLANSQNNTQRADGASHSARPQGELVIDGGTLDHVLGPKGKGLEKVLADVCARCGAVVICRSSPSQKAAVVRMMSEYEMSQARLQTFDKFDFRAVAILVASSLWKSHGQCTLAFSWRAPFSRMCTRVFVVARGLPARCMRMFALFRHQKGLFQCI